MVAEKTNAMIGPFIEVGESAALYGFPGTIKIMPQTYYLMMRDVMAVSYTHLDVYKRQICG